MLLPRSIERLTSTPITGRVLADDGTQLCYQLFGQGPTVVFANGIGVRYPGAALQIAALRRRYRLLFWDYRGVGQSVMADPEGDVSMARHAADGLTIMEHLQLEPAAVIGWSMGVQVGLEMIRAAPERVRGLCALSGSYGRPFQTSFPAQVAWAMERGFAALRDNPVLAQGALDLSVAFPHLAFAVLNRVRFVGPKADREVFGAAVRSVAGVEKRVYLRTLLALAEHDAEDVLGQVRCPVQIICGRQDLLTPPRVARHMASQLSDVELKELCTGSHYALMEQPDLINGWIEAFLARITSSERSASASR